MMDKFKLTNTSAIPVCSCRYSLSQCPAHPDRFHAPVNSRRPEPPEATDVSSRLNQINETLKQVVEKLDSINAAICKLANAWGKE